MTINEGGNDAAIENALECNVMGFRLPYGHGFFILPITLQLESMLIVLPAPIAESALVRP